MAAGYTSLLASFDPPDGLTGSESEVTLQAVMQSAPAAAATVAGAWNAVPAAA